MIRLQGLMWVKIPSEDFFDETLLIGDTYWDDVRGVEWGDGYEGWQGGRWGDQHGSWQGDQHDGWICNQYKLPGGQISN